MDQKTIAVMLALVRSAVFDKNLTEPEKALLSDERLVEIKSIAEKHDLSHLVEYGLRKNSPASKVGGGVGRAVLKAVYRCEQLNYEYDRLCKALESAQIPFMPLKGSVIRKHYPEPWMRTSCDIDVLVQRKDLDRAVAWLVRTLDYVEKERATHDVSLFTPGGKHVELHFDLVEEGQANRADEVLNSVWENASLCSGYSCCYKMSDEFFYFYHIAHMAKHFEYGGCGVRPFIDLWILDHMEGADANSRNKLLIEGDLLQFAETVRKLSRIWFGAEKMDAKSNKVQDYILFGGAYGSFDHKIAFSQRKRGGRIGYIMARVFLPFAKLKRHYPILEKHPWLFPFMQIRRWFMLLKPDIAKRAKHEIQINQRLEKAETDQVTALLDDAGIR